MTHELGPLLPPAVRTYLNDRGIADPVLAAAQIGWNGERITVPIFDRAGNVIYEKLAKGPDDESDTPKMLLPLGAKAELYGQERLSGDMASLVICEGEFDRLVLESRGIAAVTSTAGAGVFKLEWADLFRDVPTIYVCFDRDEAGQKGEARVAEVLPDARVVKLPKDVGEGGDITDFFVRLGRTTEDWNDLCQAAEPLPKPQHRPTPTRPRRATADEIEQLKALVPIESVIIRYVSLRPRGSRLVGRCPFHHDRTPSFYVYAPTHYHCFGCEAHGDVIAFLRRKEDLTFREAVDLLRRLASGL